VADGIVGAGAEFFSFGTNDLTQTTYGLSRDDSGSFLGAYTDLGIWPADPFVTIDQDGLGQLIRIGVAKGRQASPDLKIGICGEHGGDPESVKFCCENGFNYVSCSPHRVPLARLAAAQAAILGPAPAPKRPSASKVREAKEPAPRKKAAPRKKMTAAAKRKAALKKLTPAERRKVQAAARNKAAAAVRKRVAAAKKAAAAAARKAVAATARKRVEAAKMRVTAAKMAAAALAMKTAARKTAKKAAAGKPAAKKAPARKPAVKKAPARKPARK
jgi:pyruvate,orthophosphate dikinase